MPEFHTFHDLEKRKGQFHTFQGFPYCVPTLGINKVEDEYHVLLECSKYTMIRESLLPVYYYKEPNIKFINLLTTGNESLLRSLSKLVFEIFQNIFKNIEILI